MKELNKKIADYMGKKYDYIACDNCGKIEPELINPGKSRLTKCCSTYDKDSELCFYKTQDDEGKDIYAIGKTYIPHGTSSNDLKYHSDWNWLIPVIEDLRQRRIDLYGDTDGLGNIFKHLMSCDITRTHKAVADYIASKAI